MKNFFFSPIFCKFALLEKSKTYMNISDELCKRKFVGTCKKPNNGRKPGVKNKPKPNGKYPFRELTKEERLQLSYSPSQIWYAIECGNIFS